jgi:L-ribulose-5-phosphate 4-epimerase
MSASDHHRPVSEQLLVELRTSLVARHQELVRYGLVVWTAGNVSARVPGHDRFLIKASGVDYDGLRPDQMVLCDLDGQLAEDTELSPSSDTAAHAYVYRAMPDVGGVVHTHSPYACAFAAVGQSIPCVLTGIADEFGGEIPLGPFALIGSDDIGKGIVSTLAGHRSKAVLMQNHGVFTIGEDARAAVKAAVLCEDSARSVHLARGLGEPLAIAPADIDALHDRYQHVYGQR